MKNIFIKSLFALLILIGSMHTSGAQNEGLILTPTSDTLCVGEEISLTYTGSYLPGDEAWWELDTIDAYSGGPGIYYVGPSYYDNSPHNYYVPAALPGTYQIFLHDTNTLFGGDQGYAWSIDLHIAARVTATITPSGPTTFCGGGSVLLNNAGSTGNYQWFLNGDTLVGATDSYLAAEQAGNYTLAVTNVCGTYTSSAVTVTVDSVPVATISTNGPTTFCQGDSVILSTTAANAYQWSNSATTRSITVKQSGDYSVSVDNGGNCSAVSSDTLVTVYPAPGATITPNGNVAFCVGKSAVLSVGAQSTYLWSTGATSQNITVDTAGSYTVKVTDTTGCTAISGATLVTVNQPPSATITPTGSTTFCNGDSVELSANTESSYVWNPAGGGANTQTITVKQSGSYSVTVTDANGCSASSTATTVTVNPVPSAAITASGSTTICSGDSVTLTAASATTYLWSLAAGGATTQSIQASQSGSYTVTVTNTYSCSAASAPTVVTVNTTPTATITSGGATTFCTGDSVTLTASSGSTYLWSNNATTISINVTLSGNYTVTVSSASNCSAISTPTTVTVNPLPAASITAGGVTTFCEGDSVSLTASAASSYLWSNNDTTQSINVTQTGTYSVIVTDTNSCSALSAQTPVTVNSLPTAAITVSGDTTFCAGGSVTLTSSTGVTYLWSNSATTQSIEVTQSGSYTVTVANINDCSAASGATLITVNPLPAASIAPASVSFCAGGSATLTASGGLSYAWSNSANSNVTLVAATTTTTYTVTVTGNDGCSNTASRVVTVNALPDATIMPWGNVAICEGDSIALSAPIGNPDYLWSNNATTQIIFAKFTGTYSVTVTDVNNCSAVSPPDTVTVNPLPAAPVITETTETNDVLTSTAAFSYQWYMNSNLLNGDSSRQLTITQNGQYQVEISDSNGCTNISAVFNATGTGIGQIASVYDVKLYPNPNNGNFTLRFSDARPRFVSLLDVTGRLISTQQIILQKDFDCSALTSGVYYLEIKDENGIKALSVVINK